jgi:hypothetical protein
MTKPVIGLAVLGFQGYSAKHCQQVLKFYRRVDTKVIAFLYNSFGKRKANIKKWYKICDDNSITQVYLSNEVDRRKSRKDTGSVLHRVKPDELNRLLADKDAKTLQAFAARAKEVYDFHQKHGKGELRIAVGLEHQMTKRALNALIEAVRTAAPGVTIVSNPVKSTSNFTGKGKADILEVHEVLHEKVPATKRFVVTTDGYDICLSGCGKNIDRSLSNSEIRGAARKFKDAEYFLFWHSQFNSLSGDSGHNPPPGKRKSSIEKACIQGLRRLRKAMIKDSQQPEKPITPPIVKPKNCEKLLDPFSVRGFLWKESDHGGLVVLMPESYTGKVKKVIVRKPKTGLAGLIQRFFPETLEYTGVANGNREHYRNRNKEPHSYPENSVVTAVMKDKTRRCFLIKDPGKRNGQ